MSMANELAFQNNTSTPFQTNDLPQPIRIIPKAALRRESPVTGLLRENNSLLSSRMNSSHLTPAALPRPANMSKCRERPRVGTGAGVSIEQGNENLRRERPMSREKPTQDSITQLTNRPPLANLSFSRENQQQRFQAPLRVRKNSELPEHKSAMIPSAGCTGKLIEKSRLKVAEKHASRIENGKNRDATPSQQDQLLSMIEITKNNLYKDQQVIRHYMHKHKKTIDSLEQKHYEKSFERRKI